MKTAPQPKPALTGPLQGIRVLDLTRLYPGPLATRMLAGMGAEVIKIEAPQSRDPVRSLPPFLGDRPALDLMLNRSKQSLLLDVRLPEGRAIFLDLLKTADVLIESFRPGVMARAGLNYTAIKDANPKLIYVSISGYGQNGPYANHAGHDLNYTAYSGAMWLNGDRDSGPIVPANQLADVAGAQATVSATLAAVVARGRTGKGQFVDVSLLDSLLPLMSMQLAHHQALDPPPGRGETMLAGGLAGYGIFRCRDDRYLALGALEPKFWDAFCNAAGRPDWLPRHYDSGAHRDQLVEELGAYFAQKDRDAWLEYFKDEDFCLSPVREPDELADDPQIKARNMIRSDENGALYLATPGIFSDTPGTSAIEHAAEPGAHTDAILKELGLDDQKIKALRNQGVVL